MAYTSIIVRGHEARRERLNRRIQRARLRARIWSAGTLPGCRRPRARRGSQG
jgi:hypothetical protein